MAGLLPDDERRRRALARVATAAMRIDVSAAPDRTTDLLRFLRQMGYVAEEVAYATIEVAEEDDEDERAVGSWAVTLALRVDVWNAVNGVKARVVT
ncbi:MAG: hypothetical protein M3327_00745 [Actinomycetota bacterium]|nr:hypothetical protein [Actinomycetota bacterium]